MWVWSGLRNRWRALGGLSPIANKGDKQLVPTEMAGERCSRAGGGMESLPCRDVPGTLHTVCVTKEPQGAVQLLALHLPAAQWPAEWGRYILLTCQVWLNTCILFETVPPSPCHRKVVHNMDYAEWQQLAAAWAQATISSLVWVHSHANWSCLLLILFILLYTNGFSAKSNSLVQTQLICSRSDPQPCCICVHPCENRGWVATALGAVPILPCQHGCIL